MASKTKKLSASKAIEQVLGASRKPMRVPAIIEAAVPLTGLKGKTPGQTIYSVLYAEAKKGSACAVRRSQARRPSLSSDTSEALSGARTGADGRENIRS